MALIYSQLVGRSEAGRDRAAIVVVVVDVTSTPLYIAIISLQFHLTLIINTGT